MVRKELRRRRFRQLKPSVVCVSQLESPCRLLLWLAQPNVDSCIVGAKTVEQVEANARLVQLSGVPST
eukprot:m.270830 g.270830  ORF g.270830 m.270830 type:complete len:68 (+) comp40544_c2_seq34:677-880(+)